MIFEKMTDEWLSCGCGKGNDAFTNAWNSVAGELLATMRLAGSGF
jgi:hypothetical protein